MFQTGSTNTSVIWRESAVELVQWECEEHRLSTAVVSESETLGKLEMWANAQRDGRPAKHRWRPLFNTAKFG